MHLAPICLFTYKRLDTLKKTILSLQENTLAVNSELFIFSDAAKYIEDDPIVVEVRTYLKTIVGFKQITIFEAKTNKGLANSIISGVTQIINQFGKVIVLEDDLPSSRNFLDFMNQALAFYEAETAVFSIAGYTVPIHKPNDDVYFTQRASSWGWATWIDRWEGLDWELKGYDKWNKDVGNRRAFNKMGSDMSKMLHDQMTGKINSWAIRWCFNQFIQQRFTVYPTLSKIKNIGTGGNATNTEDGFGRFDTILDSSGKVDFNFSKNIMLDKKYLRPFLKQFSLAIRVKFKILNLFSSLG